MASNIWKEETATFLNSKSRSFQDHPVGLTIVSSHEGGTTIQQNVGQDP